MNHSEIRTQLIDARKEYIRLIKAELLGPGSEFAIPDAEHELISSSPTSRYSVGILYPQGNRINQDNDETDLKTEDETDDPSDSEVPKTQADDIAVLEQRRRADRNYELDETADENLDEEIGLSAQYMPSSMGITFIVSGNSDKVCGSVSFATYRNATITDCIIPYAPNGADEYLLPSELTHIMAYDKEHKALRLLSAVKAKEVRGIFEKDTIPESESSFLKQAAYRFVDFCRNGYVRVPHTAEFTLDFSHGDYIDDNKGIGGTTAKITALRTKITEELWSLTIMLVNDIEESPAKAYHCIFQPMIKISTEHNGFVFAENNPNPDYSLLDDEEHSLDLLYRHKKVYATGLGVSADWDIDENGVGSIQSDFFPESEVPPMSFDLPENNKISSSDLSMKHLSDLGNASKQDKLRVLANLIDLYKSWVDGLDDTAKMLEIRFKSAAEKNIAECKCAYERMYAGLEALRSNDNAYSAFLLANRAMFMQRVHLRMQAQTAKIDRYPDDEEIADVLRNMDYRKADDSDCKWRPFQIAFLLMDINWVPLKTSSESAQDRVWCNRFFLHVERN